jgi:hypothetical protein
MRHVRPLQGKKLLVAAIGVGTLTFAACSVFPGCNLMAAPCATSVDRQCYGEPPVDLRQPQDGSSDARPGDASTDAAEHGD